MQMYKVIALSVGAKSNKIFKAGEVAAEDAFIEGRAKELVEQGFLIPIDANEAGGNDGDSDNAEGDGQGSVSGEGEEQNEGKHASGKKEKPKGK